MKNDSASDPNWTGLDHRVIASVRSHQRRLQALTAAAFLFGFLAIASSIAIASAYFILYRPKQLQLLRDVTIAAQQARPADTKSSDEAHRPKLDFPSVQATMTHVLSFATMLVAVSVALLAMGTLVTLVLVVVQRRVTLQQINITLAELSTELQAMRRSSREK